MLLQVATCLLFALEAIEGFGQGLLALGNLSLAGGRYAGCTSTRWGAPWGCLQAGNGFVFVLALLALGAIEELGQGLLAWGACPWPVFGCASARWGLHGGACKRARGVYLYLYVACSPT